MKKQIYIIAFFTTLLCGCEDALDFTIKDRPTFENYFQTENDALASINGVYDALGSTKLYNSNLWLVQDIASDDNNARPSLNDPNLHQLNQFNIQPDNNYIKDIWAGSYDGINRANVVLLKVPEIQMDSTLKNRILGEAKFLRSLFYFNLVRMFGDVPLVLEPNFETNNLDVERTKLNTVYGQIIADLEWASKKLPEIYTSGNDKGRATKGATLGLLAKIHLTRGDWSLAAKKAKEVIDLKIYDLHNDYANNFKEAYVNGIESVFEVQFYSGDPKEQSRIVITSLPSIYAFPTGVEIILPTNDLFNSFDTNDYRKEVTFFESYDYFGPNKFDPHIWKHWDQDVYEPDETGQSSANFPVMRYSEILLIYAEALAQANSGPTTEAYAAVNQVRKRARNGNDTLLPDLQGLSLDDFCDALLEEKRFETVNEGHRWFDLVRTGNLIEYVKRAKGDLANPQEYNNLFPIPQREMDLNAKLKQNEGYY
ncbi:MAG: RagB/SusD family nutrient uptake outer membrane protein [Salinivirgaceae bacterium]|nr:RagB/SusD family nutrient uptake outer membrane protein [Salinivirgaceae bacterium]